MKTRSLETKLCILIAGLFFALLLIVGHVQMSTEQNILLSGRNDKYQSLSTALAAAYAQLAQTNDKSLYQGLTSKLMKDEPDIAYVAITDAGHRVLFIDTRHLSSSYRSKLEGKKIEDVLATLYGSRHILNKDFKTIMMPAIVGRNQSGEINVGLTQQSIDDALDELQSSFLAAFATIFMFAIFVIIMLSKAIVRPIKKLTSAVQSVTMGDLEVEVPVSSDDEIGELGATFNRMVECLRDNHHKLVLRANTDSLTDLYNHRYFYEQLTKEFSRAVRYKHSLSLIMLDIDRFKDLNDTHGHPFGDVVLQEVAKLLLRESRDIDIVARYGGEEFAIILPETNIDDAMTVAERLRASVERHCFVESDGLCVPVTVSVGVAEYPAHSTECEGLIMSADLAMYRSKAIGRNRTTAFSDDMFSNSQESADPADPYKLYLLLHADDISTIEAMAAAVDAKGRRYPGFSRAVMRHCLALGRKLGLSEKDQSTLKVASLLYDIGKLGLPENILAKPGKLTDEERCIINSHPALGYAIVQKSTSLKPILPSILHHHECWDGTGYPNYLKGNDIPLLARVISVVDAFHAMTTERVYSERSTREAAIAELRRCAATQFDPTIVDAFIEVLDKETAKSETKAA